ncbi:hypothetical protein SNK03_13588 [Fusarium graminearum]
MAAMKLHRGVLRLSSATTAVGTRREPQCIIETSWLVFHHMVLCHCKAVGCI